MKNVMRGNLDESQYRDTDLLSQLHDWNLLSKLDSDDYDEQAILAAIREWVVTEYEEWIGSNVPGPWYGQKETE
jgi:hypothetical protein